MPVASTITTARGRRPLILVALGDAAEPVDLAAAFAFEGWDVVESRWCDVHAASALTIHEGFLVFHDGRRAPLPVASIDPDVIAVRPAAPAGSGGAVLSWADSCPKAWFTVPSAVLVNELARSADPSDVPLGSSWAGAWLAAMPGRTRVDVLATVGAGATNRVDLSDLLAQFQPRWGDQVDVRHMLGRSRCFALAFVRWTAGSPAETSVWTWGAEAFDPTVCRADHEHVHDAARELARRAAKAVLAGAGVRLRLPVPSVAVAPDATPTPDSFDSAFWNAEPGGHPLAELLPRLELETGVVQTEPLPGARFVHLDHGLNPVEGIGHGETALLELLARTTVRSRDPSPVREPRFVEPGVGRTCLVDGLRMAGRPELVDFSVTGVGLTPYSWDGFVDVGTAVTGRAALPRAQHRHRSAQRLEAAGCPVAPVLAILEIADETIQMPDGSTVPAALLVRGFRCVLRVKQLDPVAGLFHSVQHAPLLAEAIVGTSGLSPAADISDLLLALDEFGPAYDDVRRLLTGGELTEPWESARRMRLGLLHRYAPVLVDLARRRLALIEHTDAAELTIRDYVDHFARSLGTTLARWRQHRFLHDYHHRTDGRPPALNTLVENNVTLLAEIPDLDTAIFVDDDLPSVAATVQIAASHLEQLRLRYDAVHQREVAASRAIVGTLAAAAAPGSADVQRGALSRFDTAYWAELR